MSSLETDGGGSILVESIGRDYGFRVIDMLSTTAE